FRNVAKAALVASLRCSRCIISSTGAYYLPHLGIGTLVVTASGVFSEVQQALNVIWRAVPEKTAVTGWLRTPTARDISWHDVMIGSVATTVLFKVGKLLIGLSLGSSTIASSYETAGSLIIGLLWIYYSAQIFLLGAEF